MLFFVYSKYLQLAYDDDLNFDFQMDSEEVTTSLLDVKKCFLCQHVTTERASVLGLGLETLKVDL
jgi:hypothetical protein